MISIKDYAAEKHVTYEAIRMQLKRYEADLKGHIVKKGRTRFLDEYAVTFLDDKRKDNPVVIMNSSNEEELEKLKAENEELLKKIKDLQELFIAKQEELNQAKGELIAALKDQVEMKALEAKCESLEKETNSYKKTIFGLYRKV